MAKMTSDDYFSPAEMTRYSRQLILPQVGREGQRKLKAASVLVVGTGGLGSPVTMYLAAAGIGCIGLVDSDVVETSNLQRQIVHGESTVGLPKVISASKRLLDLNPYITVETHHAPLTSQNALTILAPYDVIVDGTDNFPTRYLLNDAAVMLGKPLVYGSVFRFEGQASVFGVKDGPCYRCLLPTPPPPYLVPNCAAAGVFGVLPGTIGTIQAAEVLKLILGIGEPLVGRLLLYDALDLSFALIRLPKRTNCPMCGEHPTITELIDYEAFCGIPSRRSQPDQAVPEWTVQMVKAKLDVGEALLLDVREVRELLISQIEGAANIPMSEIAARQQEIPRDRSVVVFCRTGVRSAHVIRELQAAGYTNLINMAGGINRWASEIDSTIPLY
jgi:molybdopterin/thiamine biosynthesis adenylyltransferase/rhodanese-related sulfurtransferase